MKLKYSLITIFALTLAACEKDEVIDAPKGTTSIVGKWNAMEVRSREYEDDVLISDTTLPYSSFVEDETVLLDLRADNSFVLLIDDLNSTDDYSDTGIYIFNSADSLLLLRYNGDNYSDTFWHTYFNTGTLNFTVYEDYAWDPDRLRLDYKMIR